MMIRIGNSIRLTPKDVEDLTVVTGLAPRDIVSVHDFHDYIAVCKARYPGVDDDSKLIRATFDRVGIRMMREHRLTHPTHRRSKAFKLYILFLHRLEAALRPASGAIAKSR